MRSPGIYEFRCKHLLQPTWIRPALGDFHPLADQESEGLFFPGFEVHDRFLVLGDDWISDPLELRVATDLRRAFGLLARRPRMSGPIHLFEGLLRQLPADRNRVDALEKFGQLLRFD